MIKKNNYYQEVPLKFLKWNLMNFYLDFQDDDAPLDTDTGPLLDDDDAPLDTTTGPLGPKDDAPLVTLADPLDPPLKDADEPTSTLPDPLDTPAPLTTRTDPPTPPDDWDSPPDTTTEPPEPPCEEEPPSMDTFPAVAADECPVPRMIDPDDCDTDAPVETRISPL